MSEPLTEFGQVHQPGCKPDGNCSWECPNEARIGAVRAVLAEEWHWTQGRSLREAIERALVTPPERTNI